MDIDLNRINQGDGSEQRMPKTWGGYLLSWGGKYLHHLSSHTSSLASTHSVPRLVGQQPRSWGYYWQVFTGKTRAPCQYCIPKL